MIKTTYYIRTNDKNTLKRELDDISFIKVFDNVFKDYTLQKAQGRFTNKNGQVTFEQTFIVTTFNEITEIDMDIIEQNCNILKKTLNQECIMVENSYPDCNFI